MLSKHIDRCRASLGPKVERPSTRYQRLLLQDPSLGHRQTMSNSKKRRGFAALPLLMRHARPRHDPPDLGSLLMKAISAGVALTVHGPKIRAPINGAGRLDWEEHMDNLENRKAFLRYCIRPYRMPEETFDKLVQPFPSLHLTWKRTLTWRVIVYCVQLFVSSQLPQF